LFANLFPNFGTGRILKKEMLECLRDYPRDFFDVYFKDYSNGIIAGADAVVGENIITIERGIVKHNGRIYILEKDYELPYNYTNSEALIKIKFLDENVKGDFIQYSTNIFIDSSAALGSDELELGRFKLREGAILRSDYTDFFDLTTEYNTINIVNVEYSALDKSTLKPFILKYFSRILLECNSENINDILFAMQCLNTGSIEREVLIYYISKRWGIEIKEYTNMEIYKYLCHIVKEVKSGKKRPVEARNEGPMRIIVD